MSGHRERAIGRNEAMFREVNEAIEDAARAVGLDDEVAFLCECGDDLCAEEIQLGVREYERVRAVPTRFFVRPGHVRPDLEQIVERHERYWVVEKLDEAADEAEETDPRS